MAAVSDIFEKPTSIINDISAALSGGIATGVLTIIIIIVAFLTMRGRFPTAMGISTCIGAFLIGSAAQVADVLIN